jgi:hypothetical protein
MASKHFFTCFLFLLCSLFISAQQKQSFDIFSYEAPAGFAVKDNTSKLFLNKTEGKNYCQLFLYPAVTGEKDAAKDFTKNWDFFARNPSQKINDPETIANDSLNGWQMVFGAAKGVYGRQAFAITVSTFTKEDITYCIAAVFTDKKFISIAQEFIAGIVPDENKFTVAENKVATTNAPVQHTVPVTKNSITKFNTNFDDGWQATAQTHYVQVTKAGTEVRLHYTDAALDDARPNTIDAPEYYWSKYVEPYFNTSNIQKWAGVQYPVIYHMQANAVDKQSGKACYVAIKIVYSGGARPIVVVAANENSYQQMFAHPNDIDRMLNYNKFAVTANDITGTWTGGGGNGVEYYNAYSGTYAGMSAVSTADEFVFHNNGSYQSTHNSANMNNSGTNFASVKYNGAYTVTDWEINAGNRVSGKTKKFMAQLIAVRGGFLLQLTDSDYTPLVYTLFQKK